MKALIVSIRRPARVALAVICIIASACSDPVDVEPEAFEIVVSGRAERGLSVVPHAITPAGDTLPSGEVSWSVRPSEAANWSGDTLHLASAGKIEIIAEHDDARGTLSLEVAVPPTIVFDMIVDGNRDLYRVALDGEDLERLTTHPADDFDPTIGGSTIVFVSERDGNWELYSMPLDGGETTRLTHTAARERHPSLSPDGTRLAFVRGSGLTRLYIADADAKNAIRPDPDHGHGGTLEVSPDWSPDSRSLAFSSTAAGSVGLYTWSGGSATLVESSAGGNFEPAWSPDGTHLAFASNRTGDVELYLLDLASDEVRRLTCREGNDGFPTWLPDGRIVYVSYDDATPRLRWLDPDDLGDSQDSEVMPATYPIPLPGEPGNPVAVPAGS